MAAAPDHSVRAVLAVRPFRALWLSLVLSSLGDWLGLLAVTAMARDLGAQSSYEAANLAVAGVLVLRLAPAVLVGPLAGAVADRWDRKTTMVVGDVVRCALFVSIPLVGTLWWLLVATLLIEVVGLFWIPAKDATVPNLVPRSRLEAANQLSLVAAYGTAPVAAVLFTGLTLVSGALDAGSSGSVGIALYANALTYLVAALVIARLAVPRRSPAPEGSEQPGLARSILDGWRFVASTPLVRGLVIGMLGAFAAGGFVIGVAPTFVADLGAGDPGYGLLFGCVFTGLALGMWTGPRVLAALARWRLFALSITAAGVLLLPLALIPNIVIVAALSLLVGACGGVAWVTGYTLLGLEVSDDLRGRTFAFVQSAARVVLVAVMALAPALAAAFGQHRIQPTESTVLNYNGAALTLLVAAVIAVGIGVLAHRQMDDGSGVRLHTAVAEAWRRRHLAHPDPGPRRPASGFLIALEGGDGVGKTTQGRRLREWLTGLGHEVVLTREPGATAVGQQVRELLLHGGDLAPRAEALLYAADRAQHVAEVVRPALDRGAVVVTDRYLDSSIAYQGAGRALDGDEVAALSRWGTEGLVPDLTVLLDAPPELSRTRLGEQLDRLEREPVAFHTAVRERFLALARRNPRRYLVVDAAGTPEEVASRVRERLEPLLPLSPRQLAEAEAARLEAERARQEAERALAEAEAARQAAEAAAVQARRAEEEAEREAERERRAVLAEERRRERDAAATQVLPLGELRPTEQASERAVERTRRLRPVEHGDDVPLVVRERRLGEPVHVERVVDDAWLPDGWSGPSADVDHDGQPGDRGDGRPGPDGEEER
ncbi:thymidylate kinase [Quadrisphaera sp. DSM 44207]|nr:thymidylate kinase [Quadrisphaera sp. DSM 44207]